MEAMPELYDIEELPDGMFPLSLKLIDINQLEYPVLTEKLKVIEYQKSYFCRGQNTKEIVIYKDKIVILQKLQKYVVKWHHTYLLHPVLNKTEAMICQNVYWPGIKEAVQRGLTGCYKCQRTKWKKKYGKFPDKLADETPCNKLCVDLIGPY